MTAPSVTLAIPCWRDAAYIGQALDGALSQTYPRLEILVSDDASDDGTWEIVRTVAATYAGPHTLVTQRNPARRGVENYNAIMERARGDFVVIAHADDVSLPHRVERLVETWRARKVSLVCSNAVLIDARGNAIGRQVPEDAAFDPSLDGMIARGWQPHFLGATLAWERAVFDRFGGLDTERSAVSTDWILPFRAMLLSGCAFVAEPLLHVRRHAAQRNAQLLLDPLDHLAEHESQAANHLAQLSWMYATVEAWDGLSAEERTALIPRLGQALAERAAVWSGYRNLLLSNRRRPQWRDVGG